uniref:Kinesin, putative n=1 Tax=Leishmania guyanensis TaxID=5670 RepID=A0A1E1J9G5_LEIGU|nr:kinesin, putative [Leishmania guyanensis]
MEWNIPLLVYAVLQFIAFLFVLFATPIDMFVLKGLSRSGRIPTVTLWGLKNGVLDLQYAGDINDLWSSCPDRLMRFRAAQVLAIVSILVYGSAFVLGVIMLFCCSCLRFVCVALNIVGAVTLGFVWGLMVVTYRTDEGQDCLREGFLSNYGAGFVLFVIAWVLDILNIVFLLLPFHISVFRELDGANENSDGKSKERSTEHSSQKEEDEEYE